MQIRFRCSCGQSYTVDDQLAGKKVKCKSCGAAVRVPGGAEDEPASTARPDHPPQPARSRSAAVAASASAVRGGGGGGDAPVAHARSADAARRNRPAAKPSAAAPPARRRDHPVAHNRYEAISDRRHGRQNNMTFVIGGGFAIAVIGVVVIAVILLATPEDKPKSPGTPGAPGTAPTRTTAIDQVPITPPTPAKPDAGTTAAADPTTKTTEPSAPAAPVTPAPDVEDIEVAYGEMQAGPWELRVSSIELLDTFTCPAASVTQAAGGKPFVVKPTREGYKLVVVSLSAVPKRAYSAEELASINKLPILQGERKLADDELILVSDHLTLACIDPSTTARKALPPLLLYPEQADAGIAISGSNNAAYNNFAVFADEAIDLVAVYEVNPADRFLLLIARPTPQTIPTPAYRLNVSPAGALSSAGFADLVKFDPSLAPGERRAAKPDPNAPAEEPTPPAEPTPPTDAPEPPTEPAEPADAPESPDGN